MAVTLADVQAARARIADGVYLSPCPESIPLSEICGAKIYCKLDYLQRTGSFKERGARNALLLLPADARRQGVIAASAGNHALGLAYHGQLLNVPVTVVMPKYAPLIKMATCRRLGANVILHGETYGEAREQAERLAGERHLAYIHGFDDPHIIAGQGTMGLEILEQVPDVEAIVVPIGGGGLIAGIAAAVKALKPQVRIIGVEPERIPSMRAACEAGSPVQVPPAATLADGLAVAKVGELALATAQGKIDELVTVTEDELSLAVLRLVELEKSVVEGAAAASLAACLSGRLPQLQGRRVVILLCGGNIDPMVLNRVMERALMLTGRLYRFTAVITDRPGGLARLAQLIASTGASIKEITHDRAFSSPDVTAANVLCTVETIDPKHVAELNALLRREQIEVLDVPQRK